MSAAKHSPAPWVTRASRDGSGDVAIMSGTLIVAEVCADLRFSGERPAEAQANAALIAAAPELLEALRFIVTHKASVQLDPQWAVNVARLAIDKAEGRS
jgi:hypothetical protein